MKARMKKVISVVLKSVLFSLWTMGANLLVRALLA